LDFTLKQVGIPFPESEVERITPLSPPSNPFLDRLELLDDHDTSNLGVDYLSPAEELAAAGNLTQSLIDRILRNTVPSYLAGSPEEAEEMQGEENRVWAYLNRIQDMTPQEREEHYRKLSEQLKDVELELVETVDPSVVGKPQISLTDATEELRAKSQQFLADLKRTLTPEEVERFETRMRRLKRGG